jgi:hypothetical protein
MLEDPVSMLTKIVKYERFDVYTVVFRGDCELDRASSVVTQAHLDTIREAILGFIYWFYSHDCRTLSLEASVDPMRSIEIQRDPGVGSYLQGLSQLAVIWNIHSSKKQPKLHESQMDSVAHTTLPRLDQKFSLFKKAGICRSA